MNAMNMANAYKNQQIMTASPEELTLMLYNGAIRFTSESILALEQGDISKSHAANVRAQDIVREFMITLDMKIELSKNWMSLYDYIEYNLVQGNVKKDKTMLENAKGILSDMRDTWVEAMKQARQQRLQTAVGR
ncbi:flagellar protein FliS [Anaerosporomusa subterranea]|uniref:Flagellar secretion chaperone FliS n=1 Tax=Anaerosporomusa subterranea TaxID=1794912 RepID=A0A154BRD0_ANASB|nr:flagellar export chaperone FliS [Anaerosporomusa subterranea]KYZ76502.1 flagellar protein FliS [Anaerosporomusa subterranea]